MNQIGERNSGLGLLILQMMLPLLMMNHEAARAPYDASARLNFPESVSTVSGPTLQDLRLLLMKKFIMLSRKLLVWWRQM